jgi:hypothetical protein
MDLRDGRNNVPAGPSDTVFIDQNTPTTGGVVFDPNTPALTDTLYVSTTNGSTWIYNGSAYTTYTAPAVNATPFYVAGTTIDAGSNKKAIIERSGEVRVKNSTAAKIKTISGTRSLLLSSYVNSKNEILSTGDQLWLGTADNHPFYLRTNGVERLRALATGAIRFNQAYSFPTTDGTAGQALKTDGAGVLSFGDAAGGLTYFTEAQNSATPNATVKVDSLTALSSTTNADVAIVPKGTGAFTLAVADNLASGGNKRGTNAVDLQSIRSSNSQVASGVSSFLAGNGSTANGSYSSAIGYLNTASGTYSSAIGYGNIASNTFSFSFGNSCTASGDRSIAMGSRAKATGESAICLASYSYADSIASGANSIVIGYGTASANRSMALGFSALVANASSTAIGDYANTFNTAGRIALSGGSLGNAGDNQKGVVSYRQRTTDATPTILTTNNATTFGDNAGSQLALQNQQVMRFKGSITAKKSGTTDIAVWDIDGVIVRGANAASTVLTVSNVNVVTNIPAWVTPTLAANTSVNVGGLLITITGVIATNIQWYAAIDTVENIYL